MAGSLPHYTTGPDSYQVSALVHGGTLVVADGSSATTVSTAGAGSALVLGVAGNDAAPIVDQTGNTTSYGDTLLDVSVLPDYVAVHRNVDIRLTYAAAATFGALLKSAASGQVTPWISGSDAAGLIVGRCTQPGGVAAGATVGRARIFG
jgi:hypothetical protein